MNPLSTTTHRLLTASTAALCAFTLLPVRVHASPPRYTVTVLGTLGGTDNAAYGINASGQVVGHSSYPASPGYTISTAVIWQGTAPTPLVHSGSSYSTANAINASGQIVGRLASSQSFPKQNAAEWPGSTFLGTLGGTYSYGYDINDSGQAVGFAATYGDSSVHAVRWDGTTPTDLLTLGGVYTANSEGTGINASGQVVGTSQVAGSSANHAVVWNGTTPTDLGTLSGSNSYGSGINASGQVAGFSNYSGSNSSSFHAVRWDGTTPTDLGTLGGDYSEALAINDSGDVVGISNLATGNQFNAFLYTGGTMYDLDSLLVPGSGVTSLTIGQGAYSFGNGFTSFGGAGDSINDLGQIVANSNLGPVILTPIATPEPASAALLMGGGALLALRRRRVPPLVTKLRVPFIPHDSPLQPVAETVDGEGMFRLARHVLDFLPQLDDELIERARGAVVFDGPSFPSSSLVTHLSWKLRFPAPESERGACGVCHTDEAELRRQGRAQAGAWARGAAGWMGFAGGFGVRGLVRALRQEAACCRGGGGWRVRWERVRHGAALRGQGPALRHQGFRLREGALCKGCRRVFFTVHEAELRRHGVTKRELENEGSGGLPPGRPPRILTPRRPGGIIPP